MENKTALSQFSYIIILTIVFVCTGLAVFAFFLISSQIQKPVGTINLNLNEKVFQNLTDSGNHHQKGIHINEEIGRADPFAKYK
jgi:hypothetical protein